MRYFILSYNDVCRIVKVNQQAPMSEIALSVGYQSETALMRAFKREFGVSPGKWRRAANLEH